MKKLALAVALSAAASTAFAGSMSEPKGEVMIEAPVIIEETTQASSSAGIIVPLILLALVVAAASSNN
ncbi:hypothetical protein ACS3SW_13195 [Roseobacteraceae bacterium S113]